MVNQIEKFRKSLPSVVHPLIPCSIGSFRRGCYSAICRNNSFYYSRDVYNSGQDADILPPNEGISFLMESLFWGPWLNFSRCQWVSSGAQLQVPQGHAGCLSACRHGKHQHGACQRGLTSSSASFHASSSWIWTGKWGQMLGRDDPVFHACFQLPREEWLKYMGPCSNVCVWMRGELLENIWPHRLDRVNAWREGAMHCLHALH